MRLDHQVLDDIVQRILSVSSPDKNILFGSAASGEKTADSDIDLLVAKRDIVDRRQEYLRIRRALRDIERSFDIILITSDWFEQSKDVVGGIAYPAAKHGQILYAVA